MAFTPRPTSRRWTRSALVCARDAVNSVGRLSNNVRVSTMLRIAEALESRLEDLITREIALPVRPAQLDLPAVGRATKEADAPPRLESVGVYPYNF
jgi:hypothetical protein